MSEDYLWDKTGEPDPEIERLEQVLSSLRYQPKRLVIPSQSVALGKRNLSLVLAIAATIVMAIVGVGIWLRLHQLSHTETAFIPTVAIPTPGAPHASLQKQEVIPERLPGKVNKPRKFVDGGSTHSFLAKEREEAAAAKQQILLALRLASAKVNLAQKKAQGMPTIIRNQHRAG